MNELQLELTTSCNSNCTMCLRSELDRGIGLMDFDFAKKVIDDSWDMGARMIKPQWFGESTIHPYWIKVISYAKEKGMRIMIVTNGSLLDDKKAQDLVRIKADKVFFSIDSAIPEEYEKIRRGLKFGVVTYNLNYLYELKQKEFPEMQVIVTAVDLGNDNTKGMRELFKDMCDVVSINKETDFTSKIDRNKDIEVDCPHNVDGRLIVAYDGKCYLCCHDWLGKYFIGDLNENTMQEIWHSERRLNFIKNLGKLEICKRCIKSR